MFVQSEHAGKKTLTEKDFMKRSYELQEGPVLNGFFSNVIGGVYIYSLYSGHVFEEYTG